MTLHRFAQLVEIGALGEIARACYLAYFHRKLNGVEEFTAVDVAQWFGSLNMPRPNTSRLRDNLKSSRDTIRGTRVDCFRLHHDFIKAMEEKYPEVQPGSQEVEEHSTILPEVEYSGTRGYLESLAKQINASYERNLFDGCAVLMRRLLEVLLILSYRNLGIESSIKDGSGAYFMLERIIGNAKSNSKLDLSRNSKEHIETFRVLGNFSAHKIEYVCRREYIRPHIQEYRALIVELMHKAGIRS